jgi:hypothetical protein
VPKEVKSLIKEADGLVDGLLRTGDWLFEYLGKSI